MRFEPAQERIHDPFGDMMNPPAKYVVSRTLDKPTWRNTTIIHDDDVVSAVRALKARPGKNILCDGSSMLLHLLLAHSLVDEMHLSLCPLSLGGGKRLFPSGAVSRFKLVEAKPYPTGVVGLHYRLISP